MPGLPVSAVHLRPDSSYVQACNFTTTRRRDTDEYNRRGASERASRSMTTMALLNKPRLLKVKVKQGE